MITIRKRAAIAAAAFLACMPGAVDAAANLNAEVEARVRAAFANAPDMIAVAKCESGYRQFNDDGTPLHGGGGGKYVGIFQISEAVHSAAAARRGDDINSIAGNIAFARHLYDRQGSVPWVSCLPKKLRVAQEPVPPSVTSSATPVVTTEAGAVQDVPLLTANLRAGMAHPQVKVMQRILNSAGYTIAVSGPGSSGNETAYFGALTRVAVRKFQCDRGIACDGDEASTGYGNVGPRTRAALHALRTR